jgi:hypothetical protein
VRPHASYYTQQLAEESQADGWIFTVEKATSPLDAFKKNRAGDRQTDIRTAADVVSASSVLQRGGRRTETIVQTDNIPRIVPYPVRALGNLGKAHSLGNLSMAPSTVIIRRRYLMVKRVKSRAPSFPLSKRERIELIRKLTR